MKHFERLNMKAQWVLSDFLNNTAAVLLHRWDTSLSVFATVLLHLNSYIKDLPTVAPIPIQKD